MAAPAKKVPVFSSLGAAPAAGEVALGPLRPQQLGKKTIIVEAVVHKFKIISEEPKKLAGAASLDDVKTNSAEVNSVAQKALGKKDPSPSPVELDSPAVVRPLNEGLPFSRPGTPEDESANPEVS